MALAQITLVAAILAISIQMAEIVQLDPQHRSLNLQFLALTALIIAFLSSTQDIAIDAYRADVLDERELGAGASLTILGYRIALLLTGWIAFNLADRISWHWVYAGMASLVGIGLLPRSGPPSLTEMPVLQIL